jgi:hypothetical protein
MIPRMPCKVEVDIAVKADILDCDAAARREIGDFLLTLQNNPLPEGRKEMGSAAFHIQLPCGIHVSWEILGNILRLALTGQTKGVLVRILGVSHVAPQ